MAYVPSIAVFLDANRIDVPFRSVDDYIAAQPEPVRPVLTRMRSIILRAVPGAEETIAYDMPTYKLNGKRFVHFAAWEQHYALYAMNDAVRARFQRELSTQEVSGSTIRFRYSDPVHEGLIERLVSFRASLLGLP